MVNIDIVNWLKDNKVKNVILETNMGKKTIRRAIVNDMYVAISMINDDNYNITYGFINTKRKKIVYEPWNKLTNYTYEGVIKYIEKYQTELNIKNYELHEKTI